MPFAKGRTAGRRAGGLRSYERFGDIFAALLAQPTDAAPPATETNKERMARAQVEKAKVGSGDAFDRIANRVEGPVASETKTTGDITIRVRYEDAQRASNGD